MIHFLGKYKYNTDQRSGLAIVTRTQQGCVSVAFTVIFFAAISSIPGCQSDSATDSQDSSIVKPSKQAQVGPVTLTLTMKLPHDNVLTTDRVKIRVELKAPKGVTVHLEDYDQTLRESDYWYDLRLIRESKKPAQPFDAHTLLWSQEFEVEFLLDQEYELPGASATFVDIRENDDEAASSDVEPKSKSIETDSLLLSVQHPADVAALSEQDLRKIETLSPIDLPAKWSRWWILGPVIAIAALAGIALLIYIGSLIFPPMAKLWQALKRFAHVDDPSDRLPQMPAHEWAYAEIDRLMAQDLLRKGSVQRFYYSISDIVRGYVERRFDVSAPDMTTEEFLAVAAEDARFERDQQASLSEFLSACDTVKYAGQIPQHDQGDEVTGAAKQFVDHTKQLDEAASHDLDGNSQTITNMEASPQ